MKYLSPVLILCAGVAHVIIQSQGYRSTTVAAMQDRVVGRAWFFVVVFRFSQ